jgi:PIN domain nuclease of toxin-antitoxin system
LLLWALSAPEKLSKRARLRIDSSEVFASAASIWEVSIKSALGKLKADPSDVLAGVESAGFNHLPIIGGHAAKIAELPPIHKDPFDRLLVAQARCEPMILLTDDDVLGGYGDLVEVV